jgi:hypothetical protein
MLNLTNLAPIDSTMAIGITNIIVRMVDITAIGTTTKTGSAVTITLNATMQENITTGHTTTQADRRPVLDTPANFAPRTISIMGTMDHDGTIANTLTSTALIVNVVAKNKQ